MMDEEGSVGRKELGGKTEGRLRKKGGEEYIHSGRRVVTDDG